MKSKKTKNGKFSANNFFPKNRIAAMEMSVGTIVTIVLLVTVLILGVVLIKNIFSSAKGVVDITNDQLTDEVNKLFSEENRIAIYPSTRLVEIKQNTIDGIGIGIWNLLPGASSDKRFSYVVKEKCGINEQTIERWITLGRAADDIAIASGDSIIRKILFEIPVGAPLCTVGFEIDVEVDGTVYTSDTFAIKIKPK
jgi:hypothetical protein